ncbi:MAG: hypothetical protein AB1717_07975 [Pseudomonadota bacterium]
MSSFLFVNIPNTAGSGFVSALEHAVGQEHVFHDGAEAAVSELERLRREMDRRKPTVLISGSPLSKYIPFFAYGQVCMFFRDPLKKSVSDYLDLKRHSGFKGGVREFCSTPSLVERQSWFMSGVDVSKIGFVGIAERYAESLELFARYSGIQVPALAPEEAVDGSGLADEELDVFRQFHQADIKLYKKALSLFENRLAGGRSASVGFKHSVSRLGGVIQGWIVPDSGAEFSPFYYVFRNKDFYCRIRADVYRHDLKLSGLSRSGSVGFVFPCKDCHSGDELSFCRERRIESKMFSFRLPASVQGA